MVVSRFSTLVVGLCLLLGASLGVVAPGSAMPVGSAALGPRSVEASPVVTAALKPGKPGQKGKKGKSRWRAPSGPFFNDPHREAGWFTIEKKVINTIRRTPKGSTIRIAIYSLDRMPVAKALIDARRRGVKVQILLNDHWENRAVKALRAELGHKRNRKSFIYKCKQSCRGTANEFNNLHSKFYLFDRAGKSRDVIAVGSANMTLNAAWHQWNDLFFTSGDRPMFRQFVRLFNDMRTDHKTRQEPINFCGTPRGEVCDDSVDKFNVWAFPRPSRPKDDLVIDMLDKVQCLTPTAEGGVTRTRLALNMHTMRGNRGNYLAEAIREKFAEGCDFRVSYGLIGYHTKRILGAPTKRGRIPLRSTGLDFNPDDNFDLNNDGVDDLILDYYSHQKYFVVQGNYAGFADTQMVLTGSVNWSSLSTGNDEVWFTVRGKMATKKYLKNFDYQWGSTRHSRNAYTTSYVNFRVPRTVREPDGTTRRVWTTERRRVTTVERDPYRKGPYWEAD